MCALCIHSGIGLDTADAHITATHLGLDTEGHVCVCSMTCEDDVNLAHHFRSTHMIIVYVCARCCIPFNDLSQIYQHFLINPSHHH